MSRVSEVRERHQEERVPQEVLVHVPGEPKGHEVQYSDENEEKRFPLVPMKPTPPEVVDRQTQEAVEERSGGLCDCERRCACRDGSKSQENVDQRCRVIETEEASEGRSQAFPLNVLHEGGVHPDRVEPQGPWPRQQLGNRPQSQGTNDRQQDEASRLDSVEGSLPCPDQRAWKVPHPNPCAPIPRRLFRLPSRANSGAARA